MPMLRPSNVMVCFDVGDDDTADEDGGESGNEGD